ncbi:MAG: hypothetical protein ACSLFJ_15620 [Immundisolibacter sp.]|uniref:hypothetical protein n=1 Tax=Immundisolibacter sp. TaxID=1934948 RepID=UPI003EE2DB6F
MALAGEIAYLIRANLCGLCSCGFWRSAGLDDVDRRAGLDFAGFDLLVHVRIMLSDVLRPVQVGGAYPDHAGGLLTGAAGFGFI